jgi:hypothetical protein
VIGVNRAERSSDVITTNNLTIVDCAGTVTKDIAGTAAPLSRSLISDEATETHIPRTIKIFSRWTETPKHRTRVRFGQAA